MFDRIGIGVSNPTASKRFFLDALAPLGVGVVMEVSDAAGLGHDRKPSFWPGQAEAQPAPHVAFAAAVSNEPNA